MRFAQIDSCRASREIAIFAEKQYLDMNTQPSPFKMDKSAFSVGSLFDNSADRRSCITDKEFWLSKTPLERLEALEIMRQIIYGYDPSTARLQRVLEITQRGSD